MKPRKQRSPSKEPKEKWKNDFVHIYKDELPNDYEKKLEMQNKTFQKAHGERTPMTDFAINMIEDKFKPSAGLVALRLRNQLSYPHSVGAAGFAVVQQNDLIPENDFFTPGKMFEVRIIHSNFPDSADDAAPGVRCLAFKLSDHDTESPLDLLCCTGRISPFYNYQAVLDYIYANEGDETAHRDYLLKLPVHLQAHIDGVRHLPESYHNLHYYPQITYDFTGKDGVKRLARFRVIPTDGRTESGRLTKDQQRAVWRLSRGLEESRPMDYLKNEYAERLFAGPIDYLLQIQLHKIRGKQCHSMYNNSIAWEESLHPWTTLMRVSMTRQLPDDVTKVMSFHVTNLPESLNLPKPNTIYDFNVVGTILSDACDMYFIAQPQEVSDIDDGDVTEYIVHLVVGENTAKRETEVDVSIAFIGLDSCTRYRKLTPRNPTDFSTKSKNTFTFMDRPVGLFQCAKLYVKSKSDRDIYVDYLIVSTPYDGKCYTLLCDRWMGTSCILTVLNETNETTKLKTGSYLQIQRLLGLQEQSAIYQWAKEPSDSIMADFPGHLKVDDLLKLPQDLKFEGFEEMVEEWEGLCKQDHEGKSMFDAMVSFLKSHKPLDPYEDILSNCMQRLPGIKTSINEWRQQSDEAFARQIVYGPNPMKITRLSEIPENFIVPDDMEDLLMPGRTLQQELLDGKLYMVSYPELIDLAEPFWEDPHKYLCTPMCLFSIRQGKLMPLAIQLTQTPTDFTPVFTPLHKKGEITEWQMAKCWVRICDLQLHLLSVFLLGSYFLMEPVSIAIARNLSQEHALYRLLWPHLRHMPAISAIWRKYLCGDDGLLGKVLHSGPEHTEHLGFVVKQYKKFEWSLLSLPDNLSVRGLHNLPNFDYRDNGLKFWDAIYDYVCDIIHVCFPRDEDVAKDTELQNFLRDLVTNGYHENCGLPESFINRLDLVSFCTTVLWRVLGQKSAVSKDLLSHYAFTPASSPHMRVPPPATRRQEGWTEEEYCAMLPPVGRSQQFVKMCHLLDKSSEKAIPITKMKNYYWANTRTKGAFQRFQMALADIQVAVETRNDVNRNVMNTSLLPENVKSSVI